MGVQSTNETFPQRAERTLGRYQTGRSQPSEAGFELSVGCLRTAGGKQLGAADAQGKDTVLCILLPLLGP